MSKSHTDTHGGPVEMHRLDGFIDAAFAFAVSLLAIAGTEIPRSLHDLLLALDRIPAFACSFATLLIFWFRQVRWRERFHTHDRTSMLLSLALVFFALIFVYPLNMVFSALFDSIHSAWTGTELPNALVIHSVNELKALYICYALAYACMAGCIALLYWHSMRQPSGSPAERIEAHEVLYIQIGSIAVALLSLIAALLIPDGSAWSAVPGFMYALLGVVYRVAGRWTRKALAESK